VFLFLRVQHGTERIYKKLNLEPSQICIICSRFYYFSQSVKRGKREPVLLSGFYSCIRKHSVKSQFAFYYRTFLFCDVQYCMESQEHVWVALFLDSAVSASKIGPFPTQITAVVWYVISEEE
jgi:hypothetical protein